jgi:hypothetical protein
VTPRDWQGEWADILRRKAAAQADAGRLQAEVVDTIRQRRPPAMRLLRAADEAAAEIAAVKAAEDAFLREWRGAEHQA